MTVDEAMRIVAQSVLSVAYERAKDGGDPGWEDYPDIGENDWDKVLEVADREAPVPPDAERFQEAYALLSARAEK